MFQSFLDKWTLMVHDKKWWKWVLRVIADIRLYWGGLVLFGPSSYQIKGPHMREILNILKPGDVLLRRYSHYVGSRMVPGFWSHAAVYVGNNDVIHMLGKGAAKEDILTFMRCDGIKILRFKEKPIIEKAVEKANNFYEKNTDYDYGFIQGDEQLYCSELIYVIFDKPEDVKYENYILPDNLICDCFEEIWEKK